uniref:Uncharacterized protein n=1 Tax=Oryza sativa subsp. japonica TaxID=39947 RepID=Q69L03_ORYSJ|nr:hypothetical protein [Oryza sativa Japonica Group]
MARQLHLATSILRQSLLGKRGRWEERKRKAVVAYHPSLVCSSRRRSEVEAKLRSVRLVEAELGQQFETAASWAIGGGQAFDKE